MIATHNVKVNGKWYAAGEWIPEETKAEEIRMPEAKPEEPKAEEPAEAPEKPKSTSRRKKVSE